LGGENGHTRAVVGQTETGSRVQPSNRHSTQDSK
jgi:hypothetical protein